jgi:hypothetical protein
MRARRNKATYTPAATTVVSAEAKRISGVANAEEMSLRERRKARKATAYDASLAQTVVASTAAKGGAAATVGATVSDVVGNYKSAGVQFAKLAVADKLVKEVVDLIPVSSNSLLERLPFVGKFIKNKRYETIKAAIVTFGPVVATYIADKVDNDTVADTLFVTSDTLVDMGARDGIGALDNALSPKVKAIWEQMRGLTNNTTAED